MKILYIVLIACLLYLAAMIDTRGQERLGTCRIGDWTFTLVYNHDCRGEFTPTY